MTSDRSGGGGAVIGGGGDGVDGIREEMKKSVRLVCALPKVTI